MKWNEASARSVEAYLDAVERHLTHRTAAARREVLSGLRDHIAEAMRRAEAKGEGSLDAIERILAEMDPPESFAEETSAGASSPAAPAPSCRGSGRWFALGLAFLLVNAYGVWKWTAQLPSRGAPVAGPVPEPVRLEEFAGPADKVLTLRKVEQANVSPDREVTLVFEFNEAPEREQLTRHLHLSAEGQGDVEYRLAGAMGPNTVMVETQPVLAEKLEYRLAPGLPSASDARPLDREERGVLTMEVKMLLRGIDAECPSFEPPSLDLKFTAFPEASQAKEFILIEPAAAYTIEAVESWQGKRFLLRGDFVPGGIYTVTLRSGLPAANGSSLPETVRRVVQFPVPSPAVRLDEPGRYLAPGGALSVPVRAVNLKEMVVALMPVFENNLVELARRESDDYWGPLTADLAGPRRTATNALPASTGGATVRAAIDLRALAGAEPRGVYWIEVGGPQANGDGRLLVVTDLGIAARTFRGGVLVWVNSLRKAEPAAGAAVQVLARNNQALARGTTDAQGVARFEWPADDATEPFVITAALDGDLSYLDLAGTKVDQGDGLAGARYLAPGEVEAAVFSDRGVYRPGETMFLQAIARDSRSRAPEPFPALLRVRRPDGRVYQNVPVGLDEYGSARTEVRLPEFLPTGRYIVELAMPGTFTVLGETSVALEDFVPPQIRVDVEAPNEPAEAGDTLSFGVRAAYLFGRAAHGLRVTGAATINPAPFTSPGWPGWWFGDNEKEFAPVNQKLGAGWLDAQGCCGFDVESQRAWRPPASLRVVLGATVTEPNGRGVTAYGATRLDVYPFYVGLKQAWEGAVRAGETQRVAVVEVAPDGTPIAAGKPLVLTLSRVTWNSVLRKNSQGRYEWQSERQAVVIRQDTLGAGGTPTDWAFAVDSAGDYLLSASDPASGASSSLSFAAGATDSRWLAWSRERPGRVELSWDKERYRPGDVARLQVRAPFAGTGLLTVETDRVREARLVTLDKNTAEIEVRVDADSIPNLYCTLTLIRPARPEAVWSTHRALGAIALPVDRPGHRLDLRLDGPAAARPQTQYHGTVTVRAEDGKPARGAVTVLAVDEAICLLTEFKTPDPAKVFEAQRALGVDAFDLYSELMPLIGDELEKAAAPGGDGGSLLRRRLNPIQASRFKPVAMWLAALPLDANGQARFQLDLPEFGGELRLMAVAYNEAQTGSTAIPVRVKRNLVVHPALPRFLAIGDACAASVSLYNESDGPLTATLRATCGGPLRTDRAEQTIEIPAGGSAQAPLPLAAGPGPGKALCTIDVDAGAESFRDTIELAVRPPSGSRVQAVNRVLAAGESATVAAPDDWIEASLSVSGMISALPSLQMGRALDHVVHYPYGCLEQTVSGAFPLLYAAEWATRLLPSDRSIGDVSAWVPEAIARVLSMQQEDGGFAPWPFSRSVAQEASLYATHFLVEAKASGFRVPADRLDLALAWVRGCLDSPVSSAASEADWTVAMQDRAYQCHVLALAGRADAGWNARLNEQSARLNVAARAHLAAAMILAGEPRRALPLIESLGLPAARARVPGRLLDSDVRDAALLLAAWLEVNPQHEAVTRLAQRLRDCQRDGHWGNTQDDALALLAFGKLARHLPAAEQPFAGTLALPDGSVRAFSGTNDVPWSLGSGQGGSVTVKNDGPGTLYLLIRHEGVSATPEAASEQGVSIQREFLDPGGEPIDPAELPQGELIVVRITVDTKGRRLDQLVIEDLLPAGWEIENAHLATSQQCDWIKQKDEGDSHRDARDDRMLVFTGPIRDTASFHYAVRAVTPGLYALPPVTVSGMYEPEIRGVAAGGQVRVIP